MNYDHKMEELTPFDVAALQYLYGTPGTNGGIARPSGTVPPPGQNIQPVVNQRPTAFTISDSATIVRPGVYSDLVLATIHISDDGLGLAFPVLVGNGSHSFRLEQKHDHWQLKPPLHLNRHAGEQLEVTIRLMANGSGPDITPDLNFTLTVQRSVAGAPHDIRIETNDGGRTHINENTPLPSRLKIADLRVEDSLDRPLQNMHFVIRGDDAALFEIVDDILYLRAGVKLDYETNPSLDIVVGIRETELAINFNVSVGDVREQKADTPILTGIQKVGVQLAASTSHNGNIVIENIEWTRQGADDVLSDIGIFRADAPGTYQVKVTYWVKNIIFNVKQPSRTWTKTFMIAPLEDTATADGRVAQGHAFDLEEPHNPEQNDEAFSSSLPDIA
tara:strand:- start:3751 stop:4917 length:1167 start_codon:yes stop_codon:yes gene_type:complete